jgi:transposase
MPSTTEPLIMTADERAILETYARARAGRADLAQRARAMLLLAAGASYAEVTATVGWSSATIAKWKTRFEADRLAGLWGRHKGSKPRLRTPQMEARILNWTRKAPPSGATHWSTRSLAKHLDIPHTLVQRVWQRAGLQPHRLERYIRSNDPAFETKAADIIGLYLNPPQHAAVFCVDEKSAIQALDRLDPVLPMSPGRAAAYPNVRLHFTPTYSSWLNQVELWFAKIERDVIARGIFTSKRDLARKIRRYIDHYNHDAKPFRWTYADPTKRIA